MARLILHIGQAKTGTTTIQRTLSRNRDALRDAGLVYPFSPRIKTNHNALLPLILRPERLTPNMVVNMGYGRDEALAMAPPIYEGMLAEARRNPEADVLLSGESFFRRFHEDEAQRLLSVIGGFGRPDVDVYAYLRDPVGFYISLLQQQLKSSGEIRPVGDTTWTRALESYIGLFGKDRIHWRAFERENLKDGDVLTDFIDWTGAFDGRPVRRAGAANESVSAEAMSVLSMIGTERRRLDEQGHLAQKRLRAMVQQADRDLPGATRPVATPAIMERILRRNTDLLPLRDEYGVRFSSVDYTLAGQGDPDPDWQPSSIEDICAFDRDRRDAILDRVRRGQGPLTRLRQMFGV